MNSQSNEGADYDRWIDICSDSCNLGYVQKLGYCSSENRETNKKAFGKIRRDINKAGR